MSKRKLEFEQFSDSKKPKIDIVFYFVQETPARKYSVPLPRSRKLSVQENYCRTDNPLVIKKTSIIHPIPKIPENDEEDSEPEIIVEKFERSRRQSAYTLPISTPIKTRQRSNTITYNLPTHLVQNETEELVDVRDEILLMKEQFDKLVAVLDDDLLPATSPNNPTKNPETLEKYVFFWPTH